LRTPRKFQPAPSAQTTSSARGLGGRSRGVGACGVASSNRLTLARRLRDSYVCQHSTHAGSTTHAGCAILTFAHTVLTLAAPLTPAAPAPPPPVLTSLILGPALNLPGSKRLHLTFGPSQRDRWSGRAKSRILSGVRGRGCVRRASSSRPRAHRRRPRPVVWVAGRAGHGPAVSPAHCDYSQQAATSLALALRLRFAQVVLPVSHAPCLPRDPHSPWVTSLTTPPVLTPFIPGSALLQALASDF